MILMYHNEDADAFIEANRPMTLDVVRNAYPKAAEALFVPDWSE
jgi:hypothetical protein